MSIYINVAMFKCMGVSGGVTAVVQRTDTQRERVVVQRDDGHSEGWNID